MKVMHIIAALILAGFMVLGFLANNLWRWMPEFSTLESVSAFSIYVQVCLLLLALLALFMTLRGKGMIRWVLFVVAALGSIASWYSVRLSNAENAFTYGVFPFLESKVHFSKISTARFESQSVVIKPSGIVIPMPSKILGFQKAPVVSAVQSYGECLVEDLSGCVEIEFAWP